MHPILEAFAGTIEQDAVQGATTLARRAVTLLSDAAAMDDLNLRAEPSRFAAELLQLATRLENARPNMAAISNLVALWRERAAPLLDAANDHNALVQAARAAADQTLSDSANATDATVAALLACMPIDAKTLMTHSASSTVARGLSQLAQERPGLALVATEARPGREGAPQARFLAQEGLDVTVITDAAAGMFIGQCDALIIGADTVYADGSVINKTGSYLLALAAQAHERPVYVVAERFKLSSADPTSFVSEEQNPDEVQSPSVNVTVRNPTFEHVPATLISQIISA